MTVELQRQELLQLIAARELRPLRDKLMSLRPADISDLISELESEDKPVIFRILPRALATDVFEYLELDQQQAMLTALGDQRTAVLLNEMDPDDRTALLEEIPPSAARQLVLLLSREERLTALSLLGYPENSVGRLMTPEYVAIAEGLTVRQVLDQIRQQDPDTIGNVHILYVLNKSGKLIDDLRVKDLLLASPEEKISTLLNLSFICLEAHQDQEAAVHMFKKYDRTVLPVIDSQGHMLGIVTVDDVLDVAEEEATEDIQKLAAIEALEEPYIRIPITQLIKKRVGWLMLLFFGEMLTASAMGHFESEIQKAVILALFIPLIISSGGNSGSQASTLIIRALAIGEIGLKDWTKVLRRELIVGLSIGLVLGVLGFLRIAIGSAIDGSYGQHWVLLGVTISASLMAVVLWGVISGAMFPFLLKRLGLDPATSSAPFVATMVDVTGLIVYFTIAAKVLGGILL